MRKVHRQTNGSSRFGTFGRVSRAGTSSIFGVHGVSLFLALLCVVLGKVVFGRLLLASTVNAFCRSSTVVLAPPVKNLLLVFIHVRAEPGRQLILRGKVAGSAVVLCL
jgi:hypothetical protein